MVPMKSGWTVTTGLISALKDRLWRKLRKNTSTSSIFVKVQWTSQNPGMEIHKVSDAQAGILTNFLKCIESNDILNEFPFAPMFANSMP